MSVTKYNVVELLARQLETELKPIIKQDIRKRLIKELDDELDTHLEPLLNKLNLSTYGHKDLVGMRDELVVYVRREG